MWLRIATLRLSLSPTDYRGGDTVKDGGWAGAPNLKVFSDQLMYWGIIPRVHRQRLYVRCVFTSFSAAWQCLHTLITSSVFQGPFGSFTIQPPVQL